MMVGARHYQSIWPADDGASVEIIDQTKLPHAFVVAKLRTLTDAASAIRDMLVRGAPLIGVTAAYGVWLALRQDPSAVALGRACEVLEATRPTAINLRTSLSRMKARLADVPEPGRAGVAYAFAAELADEDVVQNRAIGGYGLSLLRNMEASRRQQGRPLQVMTHCNAGWLATVDFGTALAPVYLAHEAGIDVHVWVSETRPRNQGAFLTAWELAQQGVPHTGLVDNAAGHLMQRGDVDVVIVGTDRTTASGDVANKIGTYMKALAARDCGVPFYVAVPSSSIDWTLGDGRAIPIEERDSMEVTHLLAQDGHIGPVQVFPRGTKAKNFGFDVTPARLVTGLITERGVCEATREGLSSLFPEHGVRARTEERR